ncbi:hypothetical protein KIN20_003860 [Parelaphostrongylus tenuis]|uniref:Calcineurin-like phosphoesterase domain-containing protein n=1 Tax=Parelaphostrongylus tenuis TaxID=148309 RepID=A0AAD5QEP7_PARTN|nr:hypothetical protein KIN20_003860 [Parelaphostrongylus tenuis]
MTDAVIEAENARHGQLRTQNLEEILTSTEVNPRSDGAEEARSVEDFSDTKASGAADEGTALIANQDELKSYEKEAASSTDVLKKVRIAVAGCAHGEMDKIYAVLAELEKDKGYKFDLLICCGDYQMAPILTVFVGGNHEASGYLAELPNGGWVAPNIYYMGFANVIRFAGLRIAGLSGIFNAKEFNRGHYESPPYSNQSDVVSSYHVRKIDVWRLRHLRAADEDYTSNPIDIMVDS